MLLSCGPVGTASKIKFLGQIFDWCMFPEIGRGHTMETIELGIDGLEPDHDASPLPAALVDRRTPGLFHREGW
jgi:hypothetical protein